MRCLRRETTVDGRYAGNPHPTHWRLTATRPGLGEAADIAVVVNGHAVCGGNRG